MLSDDRPLHQWDAEAGAVRVASELCSNNWVIHTFNAKRSSGPIVRERDYRIRMY